MPAGVHDTPRFCPVTRLIAFPNDRRRRLKSQGCDIIMFHDIMMMHDDLMMMHVTAPDSLSPFPEKEAVNGKGQGGKGEIMVQWWRPCTYPKKWRMQNVAAILEISLAGPVAITCTSTHQLSNYTRVATRKKHFTQDSAPFRCKRIWVTKTLIHWVWCYYIWKHKNSWQNGKLWKASYPLLQMYTQHLSRQCQFHNLFIAISHNRKGKKIVKRS